MKILGTLSLTLALGALAACTTGPKIRVDAAPGINVAAYQTYSFLEPFGTDRSGYGTTLSGHIKSATRTQMDARGYRYVEKDGDLLVNASTRSAEKTDVSTMPGPDPWMGRYGRYGYWGGYNEQVVVSNYTEGTLVIDVVDRAKGQMIWSGAAIGRVTEKDRANIGPVISGAVGDIFAQYPKPAAGLPAAK
jgi:hypothetical protein